MLSPTYLIQLVNKNYRIHTFCFHQNIYYSSPGGANICIVMTVKSASIRRTANCYKRKRSDEPSLSFKQFAIPFLAREVLPTPVDLQSQNNTQFFSINPLTNYAFYLSFCFFMPMNSSI